MTSGVQMRKEDAVADEKDIETPSVRNFDAEVDEVVQLLQEKKYSLMRSKLLENNPVDIAEMLETVNDRLGLEKTILALRMLPKDVSVDVFAYLPDADQVEIIYGITQSEIDNIIKESAFDDMIDILEELPANIVDKILANTPKEERKLINTFLNYPENSAGSLMTIEYISFRQDMTVKECLAHIREEGIDSETIYNCYVKDSKRKLIGAVSLRTLVMSADDEKVSELMRTDVMSVNVFTDQEEVSNQFKRYGLLAMPVVDKEGRLVGIITVDDIFDVIDDEATEDFQLMAGVTGAMDDEYLDMSVIRHVCTRLPWLFALMCSYIVTGGIITKFEGALSAMICLVAYMPMLSGTGGNSGSQSATLIIRGLAVEELSVRDALRILWKEFRVSFIIGFVLSILNMLRVVFIDHNGIMVAFTVSLSMIIIVMMAKMAGSMLPIIAKMIGIDPALMAGPLVSSLTDLMSTLIYFLLAVNILNL